MSLWNYVRLPVCVPSSGGEAPRLDLGGFYHGFGHVFRRFGLFLALAPAGEGGFMASRQRTLE